ncbi:MAG: SemiSWEET family transporter [Candidatus Pacebacteria bacterium]|nr:SemiSWEET family transporter [Candidatus Paceibacterota bacterium]
MWLKIFVTLMGIAMSAGYYPQAYKIWKNKSARNVSILSYIIFGLGTLTWAIYGFYLKDPIIFLGFIVGVVGSWLVLGLTVYYNFFKK